MKNRNAALLLMVLSLGLLVPTVATTVQAPWEDRLSEDIALQPTGEPSDQYVIRNPDGELAIVVGPDTLDGQAEGLNQQGDHQFDRMFSIVNTGDEEGSVWLTVDTDLIEFYRGARTADSLEGEDNRVVLEPGESVDVGMRVETADGDIDSSFTVYAAGEEAQDTGTETLIAGGGSASG